MYSSADVLLSRARLDLNRTIRGLDEGDVCLLHQHTVRDMGMCLAGLSDPRPSRQVYGMEPLDDRLQILTMELENQDLADGEYDAIEALDEVVGHLVCGELLSNLVPTAEEADFHVDRLEVGRRGRDGLDGHFVARKREPNPLPLGSGSTNSTRR